MTNSISTIRGALPESLSQPSQPVEKAQKTSGMANGDFETFLKMLTTQIKTQDPLNPMESADFAVQLATFSGVEQQVQTNDLLKKINSNAGSEGLAQYSSWIGKQARTTSAVHFSGTPLTLDIQPDPRADQVVLVTVDKSGRDLTRENIGQGYGEVDWLGRDALGNPLPAGEYSFRLESIKGGEVIADRKVGVYGKIVQASLSNNEIIFSFDGGGSASVSEITALRSEP